MTQKVEFKKEQKKEEFSNLIKIKEAKVEDLNALRINIYTMRDHLNSAIGQIIRIIDSYRRYHYITKQNPTDKDKRTEEQDSRIKDSAEVDWNHAQQSLLAYFDQIKDEMNAAHKTLRS